MAKPQEATLLYKLSQKGPRLFLIMIVKMKTPLMTKIRHQNSTQSYLTHSQELRTKCQSQKFSRRKVILILLSRSSTGFFKLNIKIMKLKNRLIFNNLMRSVKQILFSLKLSAKYLKVSNLQINLYWSIKNPRSQVMVISKWLNKNKMKVVECRCKHSPDQNSLVTNIQKTKLLYLQEFASWIKLSSCLISTSTTYISSKRLSGSLLDNDLLTSSHLSNLKIIISLEHGNSLKWQTLNVLKTKKLNAFLVLWWNKEILTILKISI